MVNKSKLYFVDFSMSSAYGPFTNREIAKTWILYHELAMFGSLQNLGSEELKKLKLKPICVDETEMDAEVLSLAQAPIDVKALRKAANDDLLVRMQLKKPPQNPISKIKRFGVIQGQKGK